LGLDASKTNDLVGALAPALMGALQQQTRSTDGNNILGHLLGSKDTSRNVAAKAAESTGIDVSLIKQALPLIASLAMGALSKSSDAGNSLNDSASDKFGSLMGGDGIGVDDVLDLAKKFF